MTELVGDRVDVTYGIAEQRETHPFEDQYHYSGLPELPP